MWYLLKVDALLGAFVFSGAGSIILAMFAWEEAKKLAHPLVGNRKTTTHTKYTTLSRHAA